MWLSSAEVAILGGIICLDRVFLQAMISRPVIIGPIIGALLGDVNTGLIVGAFVELLWIDKLPMGSYVPPFDSAVAILATAGSILAGRELGYMSKELVSLSILMFVPFGILGQKMEICIRSSNNSLSDKVVKYAEEGDVGKISREHMYGLFKVFLGSVALVFVLLVPGLTILALVFPVLPDKFLEALRYTYYFIPILGVAVALNSVRLSKAVPVFSGLALVFALIVSMF